MTPPQPPHAGSKPRDAIADVAEWARNLRYEDIPHEVVDGVKQRVLDLVAAALAGTTAEGIPQLLGLVRRWGGTPECGVFGSSLRTSLPLAVLLNATTARALELDDVHERALLHPTVATVPIGLGVAEQSPRVDGRRLLVALVAAQETMCRLGLAPEYHVSGPLHRPRGWSYTYQCGILGGALVAALLRDYDGRRTLDALGNAYTALAGNQQAIKEATLAIRVQQGIAAQTAVQSADLAEAGVTGPHDVLEGMYGWLTFWQGGSFDRAEVVDGLGERWTVAEASIKPYPVCRITHNAVDATLAVMADAGIGAGDIDRIVVHVNSEESWEEVVDPLERRRRPTSPMDAQFSLPYICATAAVRGRITLDHLSEKAIADPGVLAVAQRVHPVLDPGYDVGGRVIPMPVAVDLHTRAGAVFSHTSDVPTGHPRKALGWAGVEAKVRDCARYAGPGDDKAVERAIALVRDLEDTAAPGELVTLLSRARTIPG
jgi:2-methylcitrate dehydratase PrpD